MDSDRPRLPEPPIDCRNLVGPSWTTACGDVIELRSPWTDAVIGHMRESSPADLDAVVNSCHVAARDWAATPLKERCQVMFRVREQLLSRVDDLSHTISAESGKTLAEAKAGLLKGIEVLEFATSLQNADTGGRLEVSRGVSCEVQREPLGVVAGITPFNFPAMVPMWMIPIAITLGNAFVWKPSDKTPLTSIGIGQAFIDAGLPPGVLGIVQGGRTTVEAIIAHHDISAIGFVGSTPVARAVYGAGAATGKRTLALGGAKNHVIVMPDADVEATAEAVVAAFTGCAGQRCMAASVLLAVGDTEPILDAIVARARAIRIGTDMGAIVRREAVERLEAAISGATDSGASLRLDGRRPTAPPGCERGYWLGPTILDGVDPASPAACHELFGPVLSIVRCGTLTQALAIEAANPFGNAAAVFTRDGAVAQRVAASARAGMIGINVGVPVPREPFSFGGMGNSKFGVGDITGESSLGFWTNLKKITTKWTPQPDQTWMS